MDFSKLLDLASKVGTADLVAKGASLASDIVAFAVEVKANAARAQHVMSDGDRAELDAIHEEALAAVDRLDASLAAAEKR